MSRGDFDKYLLFSHLSLLIVSQAIMKALSVIQEILSVNPEVDTTWFNYGVCLEELGDHSGATNAFIKAHELNVSDYGTHYRVLRSLLLEEDYQQLHEFIDYLCQTFEEEIDIIFDNDDLSDVLKRDEFVELKERYYRN